MTHGPKKIVLIRSGTCDYAEVELRGPTHLVAENNVGKTALIAAIQFLYVDREEDMYFAGMSSRETREFYFKGSSSYILYECLTPSRGLVVVGVHGRGALEQFDYEYFTYRKEYDPSDFLDETRRVRPWDDVRSRLAGHDFAAFDRQQLRNVLIGGAEFGIGILPLSGKDGYERFKTLLKQLMKLSRVTQDELKSLVVDVNRRDFRKGYIDLRQSYRDKYHQVRREAGEVATIKRLLPKIDEALELAEQTSRLQSSLSSARATIDLGVRHHEGRIRDEKAQLQNDITHAEDGIRRLDEATQERSARRDTLIAEKGKLQAMRDDLAEGAKRFATFDEPWEQARRSKLMSEIEELQVHKHEAGKRTAEEVEKRIGKLRRRVAEEEKSLSDCARSVGKGLLEHMTREEVGRAFHMLNPALLRLSVGDESSDVLVHSSEHVLQQIRGLASRTASDRYTDQAVTIRLQGLSGPNLDEIGDPVTLAAALNEDQRELAELERQLEDARNKAGLNKRLGEAKKALESVNAELYAHMTYLQRAKEGPTIERDWAACVKALDEVTGQLAALKTNHSSTVERRLGLQGQLASAGSEFQRLKSRVLRLAPLPEGTHSPAADGEQPPRVLSIDELHGVAEQYAADAADHTRTCGRLTDAIDRIDAETKRHPAAAGQSTIDALRADKAALEERERAVEELWKSLLAMMSEACKRLLEDYAKLRGAVLQLRRDLSSVRISNIRLGLEIIDEETLLAPLREMKALEGTPLFATAAASNMDSIKGFLEGRPRLDLVDLFHLAFEVEGQDGRRRKYDDLNKIESTGTTVTIKVVLHLLLLWRLFDRKLSGLPFFLDEVASLDASNLGSVLSLATERGFIPIIASPDPANVEADVYFLAPRNGKLVVDPRTSRQKIRRADP